MDSSARSTKVKLCQAYIFFNLYDKGFIKSKSITFTNSVYYLINKLHYILKSTLSKEMLSEDFIGIFNNISFTQYAGIKIKYFLNNDRLKSSIFGQRIKNILPDLRFGLGDCMHLNVYQNEIRCSFDNINVILGTQNYDYWADQAHTDASLQLKLDSIINSIMFTPNIIKTIGAEINKIRLMDNNNYQYTLFDITDILSTNLFKQTPEVEAETDLLINNLLEKYEPNIINNLRIHNSDNIRTLLNQHYTFDMGNEILLSLKEIIKNG